jgi:hypothetical protein
MLESPPCYPFAALQVAEGNAQAQRLGFVSERGSSALSPQPRLPRLPETGRAQHAETVRRPLNSLNSEHLHPSAVTKTSRLLKMPPNPKLDQGRTFRRRYVGAFLILLASILTGMSSSLLTVYGSY